MGKEAQISLPNWLLSREDTVVQTLPRLNGQIQPLQ
jgi:hypothetical protein